MDPRLTQAAWEERVASLYIEISELDAEARQARLGRLAAENKALHEEVRQWLAADTAPTAPGLEDKLLHGALMADGPAAGAASWLGRHLGPYRLEREIGQGGMGRVYLGIRDDEVFRQYVAVKVIRRGMDSEDILRRFSTERQILASLNHPNIARLIDGGMTEDGLSYLVMEYVDGVPLNEYCDRKRLTINERLALFQQVCEAVHYAHQNLIVHRDLKPSNIIVTPEGTPKLLDFGIAKILNPTLAGFTMPITQTELRVMTPEYASPEQVMGESITTASDIYSLGVILYELLTGHRPYRLLKRSAREIAAVVCEQSPEQPSTKIAHPETITYADGTTAEITPEHVSAVRAASVERLKKRLRGDLDTVVMKALRKEPDRRYASAERFLEDIRRHLAGRPVSAQKDTFHYRASKYIRRHKVETIAAGVVLLALMGGMLATAWQARVATEGWEQARLEAAKAEQVVDLMIGLFKEADPQHARGVEVTAREIMERGAQKVETELEDQPAVQAEMLRVMGNVYAELGQYDKAAPLLERAVASNRATYGGDSPVLAQSLFDLGYLRDRQGVYEDASTLHEEALEIRRRSLDPDSPETARSLNDLGIIYYKLGQSNIAVPMWREAFAIMQRAVPEDDPHLLETMGNLAIALHEEGDHAEAEQIYRDLLRRERRRVGDRHPQVATHLVNLGSFVYDQGRHREAEVLFRESLEMRRAILDDTHPALAQSMSWLGRALHGQGQLGEAEVLFRETLARHQMQLGATHPYIGRDTYMIATVLVDKGGYPEAEVLLQDALANFASSLGTADHPFVADAQLALGRVYVAQKRRAEAAPLLQASLAYYEAVGREARATQAQAALDELATLQANPDVP